MQQEHRIILTTLSCSFGSWAPAQVTAPCGADNPRAGSHLTRRPGSALRGRPRRARQGTGRAHPRSRMRTTFVRNRRGPHLTGRRDLFSSKARRALLTPATARSIGAPNPGRRPGPARRPSRWTTLSPSHTGPACHRGDVVAGHDRIALAVVAARVRPGQVKGGRAAGPGPPQPTAGRRNATSSTVATRRDVSAPRFGAVFPSAPYGRAPGHARVRRAYASPRPEGHPTKRRRAPLPRSRPAFSSTDVAPTKQRTQCACTTSRTRWRRAPDTDTDTDTDTESVVALSVRLTSCPRVGGGARLP
jgi:hypothetical protein